MVKFENKDVNSQDLLNLSKTCVKLRVLADFERLDGQKFTSVWCRGNILCKIVNDKVVFLI